MTRAGFENGRAPSAAEIMQTLAERARKLARPAERARSVAEASSFLVFTLADERFAIEVGLAQEVFPLRDLTPVPRTPPTILGVVNHRGQILTIIDLRQLFGLARTALIDGAPVVAVTSAATTFGIVADRIDGTRLVGPHEIAIVPSTLADARGACLRGVTPDLVSIVDPEALARDPRILVGEEAKP
jgi:purine-binding chemotaxis protein CheW